MKAEIIIWAKLLAYKMPNCIMLVCIINSKSVFKVTFRQIDVSLLL